MKGKYLNLLNQSAALFKRTNQKSIMTRKTYFEKYNKFLDFIADNFNTKKITNIDAKHVYRYVESMKEKGLNNGYIKSSLSAIRFCHGLTDSKNKLPDNNKILDKINITGPKNLTRITRGASRSWSAAETNKAIEICNKHNRTDVSLAIKLSQSFGLRLNEVTTLRRNHVKTALKEEKLRIQGKGGKIRNIPLRNEEQHTLLREALDNKLGNDYILVEDGKNVTQTKKSIENFIYRQRDNFQNPSRIASREVHQELEHLRDTHNRTSPGEGIKANLSIHGNRHTYAKNRYDEERERSVDKDIEHNKEKERSLDRANKITVSRELGHGREEVTDIYLK